MGIFFLKVRVIKLRIGGGFGGKNIVVIEIYVLFVIWMIKRLVKLIYIREEIFVMINIRY